MDHQLTIGNFSIPILYLFLALVCLIYVLNIYISFFVNKASSKSYLKEHPDAVKVHLKRTFFLVASSQITVAKVDNERPALFNGGVYVKPGKSILSLQYAKSRIGILYKSVKSYTDFTDVEVNLTAGKEYIISFDKKEGFVINEK